MDTDVVPLSHFALFVTCLYAKDKNFIFGMPQIYTCTDTQTHAQTSPEISAHDTDTDTCTQTYISTHANIHSHTCIFFYIHKYTYIYVRSILPARFIFSLICQMISGPHGPIFIYLFTSLCLFCIHIVDMIKAVLGIYFHTSID